MIGARIREARVSQHLSLSDVAGKAKISTATLSRIETDKQALAFSSFLTLSHITKLAPQDLVARDEESGDGVEPLAKRISALESEERTKIWRELTEARRTDRRSARGRDAAAISRQVEELVAQLELRSEELASVGQKIRRKR